MADVIGNYEDPHVSCAAAALDLFKKPDISYYYDSVDYQVLYPIIPLTPETRSFEFEIAPSPDFISLRDVTLESLVKIQLENGADLPPFHKNVPPPPYEEIPPHPPPSRSYTPSIRSSSNLKRKRDYDDDDDDDNDDDDERERRRDRKRLRVERYRCADTRKLSRKRKRDDDDGNDDDDDERRRWRGRKALKTTELRRKRKRPNCDDNDDDDNDDETMHRSKIQKLEPRGKKRKRERYDDWVDNERVNVKRRKVERSRKGKKIDGLRYPFLNPRDRLPSEAPPMPNPEEFLGVGFDQSPHYLLYKDCEIILNNETLSPINGLYGMQAAIYSAIWFSDDTRKSKMEAEGYYDEADMKTLDVFSYSGFKTRAKLTEESKLCAFKGKSGYCYNWAAA